jgi:hypothetical protein
MNLPAKGIGATLADQLLRQSEQDAAITPMKAILDVARAGNFTDDQCFRLLARLWTLKRMMYYVYGGWAQGINLNEYPPSVAYLFGKQTHDESTQEMQLSDEMLRRRWARTQKQLFAHPYAQIGTATRAGAYIFCLRARRLRRRRTVHVAQANVDADSIRWHRRAAKIHRSPAHARAANLGRSETRLVARRRSSARRIH